MWPLPKLRDELVTVTISPQSISCSWITHNQSSTPFTLQAYQRFACERLECERSVLFNPTYIKNCIGGFLKQHSLENAFVSLAIVGPGVVESVVELSSPSATSDDFKFPKLKKLVWEYRYLYPNDDGRFCLLCRRHHATAPFPISTSCYVVALQLNCRYYRTYCVTQIIRAHLRRSIQAQPISFRNETAQSRFS